MASTAPNGPRLVADNGPVDSERPGAGVGAILRGARLARGEDIQAVSAALRIRKPYLEAIEDGRVEDLPGLTYGIGFVRAYAEYLNLDIDETVARFKDESSRIDVKTQLQFPEPLPGNRVPSGLLLAFALLIAGSVYGGYLYTSSKDMTFVEAVEAVPADLIALVSSEEVVEPVPAPTASAPEPDAATEPEQDEASAPVVAEAVESIVAETNATASETLAQEEAVVEEVQAVATESAPSTASDEADAAAVEQAESAPAPEPIVEQVAEAVAELEPVPEPAPAPQPDAAASPVVEEAQVSEIAAEAESAIETAAAPEPDTGAGDVSVSVLPPPAPPETQAVEEEAAEIAANAIEATDLPPPPLPDPEPETETVSEPEQIETADAAPEQIAAVTEPPSTAPTAEAAPSLRIIIQATNEVWVRVVAPDGTALVEKLMLMGEIYRVPDQPGLVMETGNAGALKLIVNGTMAPSLGEIGEVRRGIALTEEGLLGG